MAHAFRRLLNSRNLSIHTQRMASHSRKLDLEVFHNRLDREKVTDLLNTWVFLKFFQIQMRHAASKLLEPFRRNHPVLNHLRIIEHLLREQLTSRDLDGDGTGWGVAYPGKR